MKSGEKHQFIASTPRGSVRLVYVSTDNEGSVSFGLNFAKLANGESQPHLTFHPYSQHLTKMSKGGDFPFSGIAMLDLMLEQDGIVKWATAITNPVCSHPPNRGDSHGKPSATHEVWTLGDQHSLQFELRLVHPVLPEIQGPCDFTLRFAGVGVYVSTKVVEPQRACLKWFHSY